MRAVVLGIFVREIGGFWDFVENNSSAGARIDTGNIMLIKVNIIMGKRVML